MRRIVHAAWVSVLIAACGGQPIGSKIPRADPAKVAVGAAAAATVMTLVDPDAAGHKPEQRDERAAGKVRGNKETVPADVLDRVDHTAAPDELPPCEPTAKPADDGAEDAPTVELIPRAHNEMKPGRDCKEATPKPETSDDDAGHRRPAPP